MKIKYQSTGFSLIELMIVVAIISILSVIAIPSYKNYTLRARFIEVIAATAPYKTAVSLALQTGIAINELNNGEHGIPEEALPTKNLASIKVENGIITSIGTEIIHHISYILNPNADGSRWTISGTCIKENLCDA